MADGPPRPPEPFVDGPGKVGHYEILGELGRGGMGVVYRARDIYLKRYAALKCPVPEYAHDARHRRQFLREAQAASALSHPNIVAIFEGFEFEGLPWIAMALVEGRSLRAVLDQQGALPLEDTLRFGEGLASALQAAHARHVLHRDVNPNNILISKDNRALLTDFGLARFFVPAGEESQATTRSGGETREGRAVGTPGYMSPEQALAKPLDQRTDLFSLGTVLYEMCTGVPAFRSTDKGNVVDTILHHEPPAIARLNYEVPEELEHIIRKALAKDRDERYQVAAEMFTDLRVLRRRIYSETHSVSIPSHESAPQGREKHRPGRTVLLAVAIVLATLAALLLVPAVRGFVRIALGLGEPSVRDMHLAVLSTASPVTDPEMAAFDDGLIETVTAKLTQLTRRPGLQVVPASEVRQLDSQTVQEAARSFGVNLVLNYRLRRFGNRARITLSLVDVAEQRQLRSEVLDASLEDPLALEDQVVALVVAMLDMQLDAGETKLLKERGTALPGAFDFYLRGRGYLRNYDRQEAIENAITLFDKALAIDPDYAAAHAGLGLALWYLFDFNNDPDTIDRAESSCQQAVRLDRSQAAGHLCLGNVQTGTGRYNEAAAEFRLATKLEPTNDEAVRGLGSALMRLGQSEEAEASYRRAIDMRPHYWGGYNWLGYFYFHEGRFGDAEEMFRQVVALAPDNVRGHSNLGGALLLQGRFAAAIPSLERSLALKSTGYGYSNLATAYFKLRRFADAVGAYKKAIDQGEEGYATWGNLADAYYWTAGQRSEAPAAYERAIELAKEELRVNPDDPEVLGELAKFRAMMNEPQLAFGRLKAALSLAPSDAELQLTAAIVYNQLGQTNTALGWLEKALEGGVSPDYVRNTPEFDNVREEEQFRNLMQGS